MGRGPKLLMKQQKLKIQTLQKNLPYHLLRYIVVYAEDAIKTAIADLQGKQQIVMPLRTPK